MKLNAYHAEIERCLQLEKETAKVREKLVEAEKRESLKLGKKRVELRKMIEEEKEAERRLKEAKALEEEKQKERRLEELRHQVLVTVLYIFHTQQHSFTHQKTFLFPTIDFPQVQVNVATDPLRVLRETKVYIYIYIYILLLY